MKKLICLGLALVMLMGYAAAEEATTELWAHEAGWMNFTLALVQDELNEAWNKAAETFGASLGLTNLDGATLKKMLVVGHQLENSVEDLNIEGNRFIARKADGTMLFDREYSLAEIIQEESVLSGEKVYVFSTEEADAGEYKYLLMTEPKTAEREDARYTTFNLVCTGNDDYRSLFDIEENSEAVAVCAMIEKDTPEEGYVFAIEKLFSNPVVIKKK